MEHKITKLPKSEIEIDVALPFTEFGPYVKKAAVLISGEVEIEGFRRGKAPYEVVKSKVGETTIYERAAELAVRAIYPAILAELTTSDQQPITSDQQPITNNRRLTTDFTPIGRPEITTTKLAPGNDLEYKIKLATLPEVKLPDYKRIARRVGKDKKLVEVSDEELDKTLDWLRESRTALITVNRPAQKGDRVEVDFSTRGGSASGGEVKDSGPLVADSKNHPLILGQGKFMPGFEDELIGMRAGEEKKFTLVAPENWHERALIGKALDFKVLVKLVQERQVPELTDEFAKRLGSFSSADALIVSVREGIQKEKDEKEKQRLRMTMIEEIAKSAKMEIPDILISSELEKMLEELKSGVSEMGMKWEDHLLHIKKTTDDLRKGWRDEAEKRVSIALCLREIARLEKIEPNEKEIEGRASQILTQFRSTEEAEKQVDAVELQEYTRDALRNEKVFEFLEGLA